MQIKLLGIQEINSQKYLVTLLAGAQPKDFVFFLDTASKIPRFDPEPEFFDFFGISSGLVAVVLRAFSRFRTKRDLAFPLDIGELLSDDEVRKEMSELWEKANSVVGV